MRTKGFLPREILGKAHGLGKSELAWKPEDVKDVLEAARLAGVASTWGSFQYRPSGLVCDVWWIEFHSERQHFREEWTDYVNRSAGELYRAFTKTLREVDFEKEAHWFEALEQRMDRGEDVVKDLYVLLYFAEPGRRPSMTYVLPRDQFSLYFSPFLLNRSIILDGHHVWRLKEVEEVIAAARDSGIACIGVTPLIARTPESRELIFLALAATGRDRVESWGNFVVRSGYEVGEQFRELVEKSDFSSEYNRHKSPEDPEWSEEDVMENLWFLVSFETAGEGAGQGWGATGGVCSWIPGKDGITFVRK